LCREVPKEHIGIGCDIDCEVSRVTCVISNAFNLEGNYITTVNRNKLERADEPKQLDWVDIWKESMVVQDPPLVLQQKQ